MKHSVKELLESVNHTFVKHHNDMASYHEDQISKTKSDVLKSQHTRGMNLHKKAASINLTNPAMRKSADDWSESMKSGTAKHPDNITSIAHQRS